MKKTRKFLAVLLSVLMLFSTVAFAASAAGREFTKFTVDNLTIEYDVNSIESVTDVSIVPEENNPGNCIAYFTVTLKDDYKPEQSQTFFWLQIDAQFNPWFASEYGQTTAYAYRVPEMNNRITIYARHKTYTVEIVDTKYSPNDYDNYHVWREDVEYGQLPSLPEAITVPMGYTDAESGKNYEFDHWELVATVRIDGKPVEKSWNLDYVTAEEVFPVIKENDVVSIVIESRYEEVIPHDHDSDPDDPDSCWELEKINKATCTKDGAFVYLCGKCQEGVRKEVSIKARGHKLSPWVTTKAPTCTEKGTKTRACLNIDENDLYEACFHVETAEIAPKGHSFGEWVIVTPPTCTEKGKAERTCTNDSSHKEFKDIDATGHHDNDGDNLCDDCGEKIGHCSTCICHKGNVLSFVMRYLCTFLSKMFHTNIKCCECMEWYNDEMSSIS